MSPTKLTGHKTPIKAPNNLFGEKDYAALQEMDCGAGNKAFWSKRKDEPRKQVNKSELLTEKPIVEDFDNSVNLGSERSIGRYGKRSQSIQGYKPDEERIRKLKMQVKQMIGIPYVSVTKQQSGTMNYADKRYSVGNYQSSRHDAQSVSFLGASDFKKKQSALYENEFSRQMRQTHEASGLAAHDTLPELKNQYNAINAKIKKELTEQKKLQNEFLSTGQTSEN